MFYHIVESTVKTEDTMKAQDLTELLETGEKNGSVIPCHGIELPHIIIRIRSAADDHQFFIGSEHLVCFDEIMDPFFRHETAQKQDVFPGGKTKLFYDLAGRPDLSRINAVENLANFLNIA